MTAPRLPNLFKVPELKEKILFTLLCLVVYRIGAHIATPGVNVQALADFLRNQGQGTLFSLYDLFAGGGFGRATVFALGIMPYISASIVFQLAAPVFPVVEKMQRDEEGRKKLTQWTRYLTVVLCLFQAYGYGLFTEQIPGAVASPGFFFRLTTVLTLTTGGVFVMWLGEQITERHRQRGEPPDLLLDRGAHLARDDPHRRRPSCAQPDVSEAHHRARGHGARGRGHGSGHGRGAAHSHSDSAQGDGARPHPRGPEDVHPAAAQHRERDADHLRAVAHHRPRDDRRVQRQSDPEAPRRVLQRHVAGVPDHERAADHFLRLLLHVDHLQPCGSGGEPEEAGRLHPGREARRRHGGLHRRRAVPHYLPGCHLPHGRGHAADRGLEHLQHAVRLRRHRAAHRGGGRARLRHPGAAAPAVAALRWVHEGRARQVPRPPAVHVGGRCSSSS